jgi:hypothetical protein
MSHIPSLIAALTTAISHFLHFSIEDSRHELQILSDSHPEVFRQVLEGTEQIKNNVNIYYSRVVQNRELCKMWREERGCVDPEKWWVLQLF